MLPNFPAAVPDALLANNRTVSVDDRLYKYLLAHSLREPELLQQLRRETAQYHMARMQLSPEVGQFLALLVKIHAPMSLLEIGVFTGYSTLCLALSMPATAQLVALEKKQMWLDIANRYLQDSGRSSQVTTICGKALTYLQPRAQAYPASVDFIFIDADKANQLEYYQLGKTLLRSGGLMVIDNTLWWGNVADDRFQDKDTAIVRQLNRVIHEDGDVEMSLLPIGDGLTLVRKL